MTLDEMVYAGDADQFMDRMMSGGLSGIHDLPPQMANIARTQHDARGFADPDLDRFVKLQEESIEAAVKSEQLGQEAREGIVGAIKNLLQGNFKEAWSSLTNGISAVFNHQAEADNLVQLRNQELRDLVENSPTFAHFDRKGILAEHEEALKAIDAQNNGFFGFGS